MPLLHFGALRCSPLAVWHLALSSSCSPAPCAVPPRSPPPCAVPLSQPGALRCPPFAARRLA
eukprot:5100118-Pleurochrysis_carterae.AAC.1